MGSVNIGWLLAMVRLTGGLVRGPNRGVAFKELMGLGGGEKEKDTLWNYLEGVFSKSGTQSRHDYSPYLASEQMLFGEDLGYLLTPGMDQHPTPPHTPCPSGHRPPQAAGVPFSGLQANQFNNSWALRKYPMASSHFKYLEGSKMP